MKKREQKGNCRWCGHKLDRKGALCKACVLLNKQRQKKYNQAKLLNDLCTSCGKKKEVARYWLCKKCRIKNSEKSLSWYYRNRERVLAYRKQQYAKKKQSKRPSKQLLFGVGNAQKLTQPLG